MAYIFILAKYRNRKRCI